MKLTFDRIAEPFHFQVANESGVSIDIDASPQIGGGNNGMRPMELLASGLAACIAIDVLLILKKQRTEPTRFAIDIEGIRKEGVPSPFESVHLLFHVNGSLDLTRLRRTIQMVIDKYCSVRASLDPAIKISFDIDYE